MTTAVTRPDAVARPRLTLRTAEIGLAVYGLIAATLVVVDAPGPVRSIVVLIAVLILPGWTILRRFPTIEPAARLVFTAVGSIVVLTLLSLAMVWTQVWHARAATVLVLVVAAVLIVRRPVGVRGPSADLVARAAGGWAPRDPVARISALPWLVLVVAAALWIVGLTLTNSTDLGQFGLLVEFPVYWYAAVVIAFVVALVGLFTTKRAHGLLASALALLIVILYGSANLVENAPRLPWVYKHIAVTNYIVANGSVDPSIDLYNRWPGFFSFSATVSSALGIPDATHYATWAEVFFALVDAVLVLAIARTISRHRRWAWTSVIVFTVGNWVGQNYYSPQAFAFMLYLTAALVAVSALGSEPRRLMVWFERQLARPAVRLGRAINTEVLGVTRSGRGRILPIVAVVGLQGVIVASHQLTPYVAILALVPLFVLGYLRPLWVAIALVALPVLYLLPNLPYVSQHFGLFSSFNPGANISQASVSSVGVSEAASLQSHGVVLLTGFAVLLALAGFTRRILNGHVRTTVVVAWLAIAPVFTLLGQSYGGEGKFRIFLFGLPFYAMGVSWLFWTRGGSEGRHRVRRVSALGLISTLSALLVLFVGTYFQPEASLRISASDVRAAQWLDKRFAPSDYELSVTDTFPVLIGPHYPDYLLRYLQTNTFADVQSASPKRLSTAKLLESAYQEPKTARTWVVFSDDQEHTAVVAGVFTRAQLDEMEMAVAASGTLSYDRDGVRIYETHAAAQP
ncbi:hypothetical protein EDF46_1208 [Frondihabitans sp. PhB188]|uniref:hypothetical protein n=1 Tax=Frondihabitans sp. PhB188 TaxID=2485200 RepID=UPI000F476452|nr:hypothetical protein [Frondihabitans sp. PhB188]ROQ39576.1 hypothetical protein EDF46_1208 [Frondihabitans sp. PhB188]